MLFCFYFPFDCRFLVRTEVRMEMIELIAGVERELEEIDGNSGRVRKYVVRIRVDNLEKWDDDDFIMRYNRLSKENVYFLLSLIGDGLKPKVERKVNLTPMCKLLITLRFYALGSFLISIGKR